MYASFCYRFTNWIFHVRYWKGKTGTGQCFKCDWFLQRKWMTWCITAIRSSYFCYKSQASARPFSTGSLAKLSWTAMGTFHKNFPVFLIICYFSLNLLWQMDFRHDCYSTNNIQGFILEGFIEKSLFFPSPMRKTVQFEMLHKYQPIAGGIKMWNTHFYTDSLALDYWEHVLKNKQFSLFPPNLTLFYFFTLPVRTGSLSGLQ